MFCSNGEKGLKSVHIYRSHRKITAFWTTMTQHMAQWDCPSTQSGHANFLTSIFHKVVSDTFEV